MPPVEMRENLVYCAANGERGLLDLVLPPAAARPVPVVICLHGGGWNQGSKAGIQPFGRWLAELGLAAVLPNYRLTATHAHPAQQEDVLAVLHWVAAQAGTFGFDASRLGLAGSSAGAHLAALVGLKATRDALVPGTLRCIFAVCGVFDLARWVQDRPASRSAAEGILGGRLEDLPAVLREVSPISNVHANSPVVRCVHGARDEIIAANQSEQLVAALRRAGAAAELQIVPGEGHRMTTGGEGIEPLGGRSNFVAFFTRSLLVADAAP